MSYYILQNDETKGPYTIGQLRGMWSSGAITTDTLYCREGWSEWLPLLAMARELEALPPSAPHTPTVPRHESGSKRSSRHNKAIGAVMVWISIPGCMASAISGDSGIGMVISAALFFVGITLFIAGRFQE